MEALNKITSFPTDNPLIPQDPSPAVIPIPSAIAALQSTQQDKDISYIDCICLYIEGVVRAISECIVEIVQSILFCKTNDDNFFESPPSPIVEDPAPSPKALPKEPQTLSSHTKKPPASPPSKSIKSTETTPSQSRSRNVTTCFGLSNPDRTTCFANTSMQLLFRLDAVHQRLLTMQSSYPDQLDQLSTSLTGIWHTISDDLPTFSDKQITAAITSATESYQHSLDTIKTLHGYFTIQDDTTTTLNEKDRYHLLQQQKKLITCLYEFSGSLFTLAYLAKQKSIPTLDRCVNKDIFKMMQSHIVHFQNEALSSCLLELRRVVMESDKMDQSYEQNIKRILWSIPGLMDNINTPDIRTNRRSIDSAFDAIIKLFDKTPFNATILGKYIKVFFPVATANPLVKDIKLIFSDIKTDNLTRYQYRVGAQQDAHEFITLVIDRLNLSPILGLQVIKQKHDIEYIFDPTKKTVHVSKKMKDSDTLKSYVLDDMEYKGLIKQADRKDLVFKYHTNSLQITHEQATKESALPYLFAAPNSPSLLQATIDETCFDEYRMELSLQESVDRRKTIKSNASFIKKYFYLDEDTTPPEELVCLLKLFAGLARQTKRELTDIFDPVVLHIYHGTVEDDGELDPNKIQDFTYEPIGFGCQIGTTIQGGHYVYHHKEKATLTSYNDSIVSPTSDRSLKTIGSDCYLISYRLKQEQGPFSLV
ncbi:MAG: ubiquitin carboxyl-terminal hydrolase [Chlamydiales bacterium]|nr:ubiquitin carboxyl-terminal hydrolase [Chlamydiales bacterium]